MEPGLRRRRGSTSTDFRLGRPVTTLAASPVTAEAPFLQVNSSGNYSVFVPAVRHGSVGPSWTHGPTSGSPIAIQRFFIATPRDPVAAITRRWPGART